MGLATLTLVLLCAFPVAPFPKAATQAGSVNGTAFVMATGTTRDAARLVVPRLVTRYGAQVPRAVWFERDGRGLFWQWLGPARFTREDVREAVRTATALAKKTAQRNVPLWGWLAYLYDTACAARQAEAERCELLSIRNLAQIVETLAPVGAWQVVELHPAPDGATAWTWVAFDGGRLSRLLPSDDPDVLANNCRYAPYPLPGGAQCQVVASFAGATLSGRFVSFTAAGSAASVRTTLARNLTAAGWVVDGERYLGPTGASLRVQVTADRAGARALLMEAP